MLLYGKSSAVFPQQTQQQLSPLCFLNTLSPLSTRSHLQRHLENGLDISGLHLSQLGFMCFCVTCTCDVQLNELRKNNGLTGHEKELYQQYLSGRTLMFNVCYQHQTDISNYILFVITMSVIRKCHLLNSVV